MKRVKLIMKFKKDNEVFNKDQEIECKVIPLMNYNNGQSHKAVYRVDYILKKTEYVDIPFKYEGDLCEVFEVLIDD